MHLIQLALVCVWIGGAVSLQCYFCADGLGDTTPACRDPFNEFTTDPAVIRQTCPTGSYSCSKSYLSTTDLTFTVRGCVANSLCPSSHGCASGTYQGNSATACCCPGDFCNGAAALPINLLASTAAVGLAALVLARS